MGGLFPGSGFNDTWDIDPRQEPVTMMETTAQLKMGLSKSGMRPQVGSEEAPNISYSSADETWYDYQTVVSLSPTNTGGSITSYAAQAGTLPAGVSLNTSTGAITGTP